MEEKKIPVNPVLTIDGVPLNLDKNKGPMGLWIYETAFNRSLTNDLLDAIDPTIKKIDALFLYRLIYVMSGINERLSFLDFLNKIPEKHNVLEFRDKILEKAADFYFPM